jgi:hypothetical protein
MACVPAGRLLIWIVIVAPDGGVGLGVGVVLPDGLELALLEALGLIVGEPDGPGDIVGLAASAGNMSAPSLRTTTPTTLPCAS